MYYIYFAQIINIRIEISVQSFTDTVQFLIYRCSFICDAIILVTLPSHHTANTLHCHHTTLPPSHTAITSHCHHITLPSHHTAIAPHCHHTTLPSHHIAITPHCHRTTLPSHHTAIPPHCHHTTLPSNHNAFTQYLTSRYLMGPARLLQAVTRHGQ